VNHSPELDQLAPALCGLQAEIEAAPKGTKGQYGAYSDLPTCWATVQPLLAKHGLGITQTFQPTDRDEVCITTTLLHKSGQYISGTLNLPYGRNGGPQGAGAAVTYGRRYGLAAIVGLVTDKDDDAQGAQNDYQNQRSRGPAKGGNDLDDLLN
jgi:hypothetical protein